jgi:ribosomal-protein-alanine N-acetyltransferase
MDDYELRPFGANDAEAAHELHRLCFPDPWPTEAFRTLLEVDVTGFCMVETGRLAGFILFRAVADEAEILTFAVDPADRRRGLGARLALQVVVALESKGIPKLLLEVAEDNEAARSLYAKLGFVQVGERAGYYSRKNNPVTALILTKTVKEGI